MKEILESTPELLKEAIASGRAERPHLESLFAAFEPLLLAKVTVAERLFEHKALTAPVDEFDRDKFLLGAPVAARYAFPLEDALLMEVWEEIYPAFCSGFPALAAELARLKTALRPELLLELCRAHLQDGESQSAAILDAAVRTLDVSPEVLRFILSQLVQPLARARARFLAATATVSRDIAKWTKAHCPICGSWAGLACLAGEHGERRLICSFCGHNWSYLRSQCAFCENDDEKTMEFFYLEDQKTERADVCHTCGRYLNCVDIRWRSKFTPEIASIELAALDLIMQEKGFTSGGGAPITTPSAPAAEAPPLEM